MWFLFAFIGYAGKAFGFLSDKLFIEKLLPSPKALAFLSGIGGVFFLFAAPWYLRPASFIVLAASIGAGVISIPALIYFYRAVDRDEISRVVPAIGSLTPMATVVFSYAIVGERFDPQTLLAFAFLVGGGILAALHSFANVFKFRNVSLFVLEAWVAFLFAASAVLLKYAFENTDDVSAFLWFRIGSIAACLPLLFNREEVRGRIKRTVVAAGGMKKGILYLFSRLVAGLSPLAIWAAVSYGSVSLVNAMQGIQYPILLLLAAVFSRRWPRIFQEEINSASIIQKSLAAVFIVIGLALLF